MNQLLQEMFLLSNPNAIQKILNVSLAVLNSTRLIPEMYYRRQRIWFCRCTDVFNILFLENSPPTAKF